MLVVFERSALGGECGVPVFRPGPSAGLWCERKEWLFEDFEFGETVTDEQNGFVSKQIFKEREDDVFV